MRPAPCAFSWLIQTSEDSRIPPPNNIVDQDIVVGNAVRNLRGAAGHGNVSNLLRDELTCMLCSDLYYEPWTAPCGHSFCEPCVARSLDHSPKCPGCRRDIGGADADDAATGFLMLLRRRPNLLLKSLVATLFAPEVCRRVPCR